MLRGIFESGSDRALPVPVIARAPSGLGVICIKKRPDGWRAGFVRQVVVLGGCWSVPFALAFAVRLPGGWPEPGQAGLALVPLIASGILALYVLRHERDALRALLSRWRQPDHDGRAERG